MNDKRYRWILYTIVFVIACTIGIQIYWNYKNYLINKQQLINDVQTSLDKAVDDYYANLAQKTTLGFAIDSTYQKDAFKEGGWFDQVTKSIDENNAQFGSMGSLDIDSIKGVAIFRGFEADSMMRSKQGVGNTMNIDTMRHRLKDIKYKDSKFEFSDIEMLTSKVVISINNDTLVLKDVDSLLKIELARKHIDVDFNLKFKDPNRHHKYFNSIIIRDSISSSEQGHNFLNTFSRSAFLPEDSELSITFTNETQMVLRRILGGILISTLLVLAVISCLFYLLKIIKTQKQLAEIKNDLISNITHEFKTPIATIGVALESINSFNVIEDKEKTKTYIEVSSNQLSKLNIMVEKLLETASLDSNNLDLKYDRIDLVQLLTNLVNKFKVQETTKTFKMNHDDVELMIHVDPFHFENAINNILDNAIKYGGNNIEVSIIKNPRSVQILISDNGQNLSKANKDRIFEKFYRVPKGNTHDVKGFGIGLYYTKTIINKHQGTITLDLSNALTTFKIDLPND